MGINGGFFDAANGYDAPPTGGSSIAYWHKDIGGICYSGTCRDKIFPNNENSQNALVSRKTAVIYKDSNNNTRMTYLYAKTLGEVLYYFPTSLSVIGGRDYNYLGLGDLAPIGRTAIAWKSDGSVSLIVSPYANVETIRYAIYNDLGAGYSPENSVLLDGSGSSCMQVFADGTWNNSYYNENRYLYNIVRLINAY